MVKISTSALCVLVTLVIASCRTYDHEPWIRNVPPQQVSEINRAIHTVTSARITSYVHHIEDPPGVVNISTADGRNYIAERNRGRWRFREVVIVY